METTSGIHLIAQSEPFNIYVRYRAKDRFHHFRGVISLELFKMWRFLRSAVPSSAIGLAQLGGVTVCVMSLK